MLQELYSQVERVCSRVGIDQLFAYELFEVAVAALGRTFFENPRKKKDPITQEPTIAHPLLRQIDATQATPEAGVGSLLELGLYLHALAGDPVIGGILSNLQNEKLYESTHFHLAMAYRLVRAGCRPTLEPKTDRGKSDILFTFHERMYVAECYSMQTSLFEHIGEFESLFARRLIAMTPQGKTYRFVIHINALLTYDGMRRMLRKADELMALFHSRGDLQLVKLKHGPHLLSVEDITGVEPDPDFTHPGMPARPLREDEADLIVCRSAVPMKNIFEKIRDQVHDSRALIRRGYERTWPKDPYEVLEGKIGHKLKQTKISHGDYGRLLFVEFPWGLEVDNREKDKAREKLSANLARNFPTIGAVALLERRPSGKHFGYHGVVLTGNKEAAVPHELVERLSEVERQGLFWERA